MATITVPYRIMPKGYQLEGDVRSGLKATVPVLLAWSDAFTFLNEVLVSPSAIRAGLVSWNAPLQFPVPFGGRTPALYVQGFSCLPCGASGIPVPEGGNAGLAPGEFYTNAIVTLRFESITSVQQAGDDPNGLNQLDPENPITACEQSVKLGGKMTTVKGRGYQYKTSGKPIPGDMAVPSTEAKLILKFPRIPYLPWQLVAPFVGKVNQAVIFGTAVGALLLDGMDTDVTPQPDGSIQQKLVLEFSVNLPADPGAGGSGAVGTDWNSVALNDGSGGWDLAVSASGGVPAIGYVDFRQIFNAISF